MSVLRTWQVFPAISAFVLLPKSSDQTERSMRILRDAMLRYFTTPSTPRN